MTPSAAELEGLAAEVNALTPPDRLRLAAGLLEARRASTALPIIQRVALELSAALMLAREEAKSPAPDLNRQREP